jgi:hypothetical protein
MPAMAACWNRSSWPIKPHRMSSFASFASEFERLQQTVERPHRLIFPQQFIDRSAGLGNDALLRFRAPIFLHGDGHLCPSRPEAGRQFGHLPVPSSALP